LSRRLGGAAHRSGAGLSVPAGAGHPPDPHFLRGIRLPDARNPAVPEAERQISGAVQGDGSPDPDLPADSNPADLLPCVLRPPVRSAPGGLLPPIPFQLRKRRKAYEPLAGILAPI